jgi:(1->4)-alpha-D-glucan 1-alpha-D-glucosylmutase
MVSEERYAERLKAYMIKAVREAKAHSEWFKPDEAYEQGLEVFIDAVLDRAEANAFIADFEAFVMRTAFYGMLNSLSQTVLKIASPGVPDFYQGCELWDLSMVDPDNRRQVDFATRAAMLKELKDGEAVNRGKLLDNLLFTMADGRVKLYTIMCGLRLRNMMREVFESGRYIPLRVSGKYARNILAFARVHKGRWVAAIVGRFFTGLVDTGQMPLGTVWAETAIELPGAKYPHTWINAFTDENVRYEKIIPVGQMLAKYPAGLFWGAES